jgi:hypothetical protein
VKRWLRTGDEDDEVIRVMESSGGERKEGKGMKKERRKEGKKEKEKGNEDEKKRMKEICK